MNFWEWKKNIENKQQKGHVGIDSVVHADWEIERDIFIKKIEQLQKEQINISNIWGGKWDRDYQYRHRKWALKKARLYHDFSEYYGERAIEAEARFLRASIRLRQLEEAIKGIWPHVDDAGMKEGSAIEKAWHHLEDILFFPPHVFDNLKPCDAIIWHGPGHQSKTQCQLKGPHETHEAIYGSMDQIARWKGKEVFSGFFDEPPRKDD